MSKVWVQYDDEKHVAKLLKSNVVWIDESSGPRTCYVVNRFGMDEYYGKGNWGIAYHCPDFLVLDFTHAKHAAEFLLRTK